jgi:hypothetical protein
MEVDLNSESKILDVVVQDRYPDTLLANDRPAAVDQIVIKLEEVVAKETPQDQIVIKSEEVVAKEMPQVQDGEKMVMEEVVMGAITVLPDSEGLSQCHMNPTVQARIRTFS